MTYRINWNDRTLRLRLHRVEMTGPKFRVLVQGGDGTLKRRDSRLPATYLGTVKGSRFAVVSAVRRADGKGYDGQVEFDRGGTIRFEKHQVVNERGLDQPTSFHWPSADDAALNRTVSRGQIGSVTRRWDIAFDLDTSYFRGDLGGSVKKALEQIALTAVELRATYERDARLRPVVGRVILRASAAGSPYPSDTSADLGVVRDWWAKRWPDSGKDPGWDDVAYLHDLGGGGVAYVGTAGGTYGVAKNGGGNDIDVIRHELGHTWSAHDNHTNGPEGQTIESGNAYARFDGTELRAILGYRDTHTDSFPKVARKVAEGEVSWPPYAALDLASGVSSGASRTIKVLANDGDANGDRLSLQHVGTRSHLGARLRTDGNRVVYRAPKVDQSNTVDWFRYVVQDATGRRATGLVLVRVNP